MQQLFIYYKQLFISHVHTQIHLPDNDIHHQAVSHESHHAHDHVDQCDGDPHAARKQVVRFVKVTEVVLEQRLVIKANMPRIAKAKRLVDKLHLGTPVG